MSAKILKFGLIAGVVLSLLFLGPIIINPYSYMDPDQMARAEIIGYAIMIGSMMLIVWGMVSYYKAQPHARFGKLFLAGLGMTVVANLIFYFANVLLYEVISPDFLNDFGISFEKNSLAQAPNAEKRKLVKEQLASMKPIMENSYLYAALMAGTTFFIGIIISAISALVVSLRKSN